GSISINCNCLTVTDCTYWSFSVDVMSETFKSTTLSKLAELSLVKLERSMSAEGRFGGHFVTGHVDGTDRIIQKTIDEDAYLLEISVPEQLGVYLMSKGSIAIDGVSLTIFGCDAQSVR